MSDRSKLTRAEQVPAEAFALAVPTVAGRGQRTFLDLFTRAEEIEHWLYQAQEPLLIAPGPADIRALRSRNGGGHE